VLRLLQVATLVVCTVLPLWGVPAHAADAAGPMGLSKKRAVPQQWAESIGAQLYDDWPQAMLQVGPFVRHPLWRGARNALARETWRCVNCHGWDFRGSDGVGGDLGPVPGVPGLRGLVGADRDTIRTLVRADRHGFAQQPLNVEALDYLVSFLARGQRETVELASRANELGADRVEGGQRYATVCQLCHGPQGDLLNLGTERVPETISSLARRMPWKFLHAVRFGHGGVMPSFVTLDEKEFLNLLVYAAKDL